MTDTYEPERVAFIAQPVVTIRHKDGSTVTVQVPTIQITAMTAASYSGRVSLRGAEQYIRNIILPLLSAATDDTVQLAYNLSEA